MAQVTDVWRLSTCRALNGVFLLMPQLITDHVGRESKAIGVASVCLSVCLSVRLSLRLCFELEFLARRSLSK